MKKIYHLCFCNSNIPVLRQDTPGIVLVICSKEGCFPSTRLKRNNQPFFCTLTFTHFLLFSHEDHPFARKFIESLLMLPLMRCLHYIALLRIPSFTRSFPWQLWWRFSIQQNRCQGRRPLIGAWQLPGRVSSVDWWLLSVCERTWWGRWHWEVWRGCHLLTKVRDRSWVQLLRKWW